MGNVPNLGMARNTPSPFPNLAAGLVNTNPSYGVTAAGQTAPIVQGAPTLPWTPYQLPNLTAADSDYFAASFQSGTGVTTKSNVLGTLLNAGKMPQLTDASGYKFTPARNLVITSDSSKSCVFTIQFVDENDLVRTKVLTISLTSAGYATTLTAKQILSISLAASAVDAAITYGYGNRIGLPHPLYSLVGNIALVNTAGTGYPNSSLDVSTAYDNIGVMDATNIDGITPLTTPATTNIGVVTGAIGTAPATFQTIDLDGLSQTSTMRFVYTLPASYIPGGTISILLNAGALVSVASATLNLDIRAFKNGLTPDICATAAQSINSLTAADKTFVITPTGLVPGDRLDVEVSIIVVDVGADEIEGVINRIGVLPQRIATALSENETWTAGNPAAASTVDASCNGSVRLGSTDLSSGTGAPDGTADFLLMWVVSDPVGVLGTNGNAVYRSS